MTESLELGQVHVSRVAAEALERHGLHLDTYLEQHRRADWSHIPAGMNYGSRHPVGQETQLLIITDADETRTQVLLDQEIEVVELGVREGYAAWSAQYDQEPNPLIAVEEPRARTIMEMLAPQRALDVACGTGRHALWLAQKGIAVSAIDLSPDMLHLARTKARQAGLELDWRQGSVAEGLPYADGSFDLVVCALALSHMPDLGVAFSQFYRVLAPGGHVLITDFHPSRIEDGWLTVFHRDGRRHVIETVHHTRQQYLDAAQAAGFAVRTVLDVPVKDAPPGYLPEWTVASYGEGGLCLILVGHKA